MTIINTTNPLNPPTPIAQLPDPTNFPQAQIRIGVYAQIPQGPSDTTTDPGNSSAAGPAVMPYMLTADYDTVWVIAQRWERIEGILQMPVAAPEPYPSAIVKTHASSATRVVAWTAARFGDWPFCPSPIVAGYPNQTLRYYSITPAVPTLGPDSRPYFRISGLYVYVLTNSLTGTETLPAGKLPFNINTANGLNQTQFQDYLGFPT